MKQPFFSRHSRERNDEESLFDRHAAEIFLLSWNDSSGLFDITMKNLNQVFGGASFAGVHFGSLAEDVITNLAVNNFD